MMDWGPGTILSTMVCASTNKVEFRQEGVGKVVKYFGVPLPITAPSSQLIPPLPPRKATCPAKHKAGEVTRLLQIAHPYTTVSACMHYSIIQHKTSRLRLLVFPNGSMLLCSTHELENHSSLSVYRLSEQNEGASLAHTFEEWSLTNSPLVCTKLRCCRLLQVVEQLDSAVIHQVHYLSVTSAHQVMVFEVPLSTAMSCKWVDQPRIHESVERISHSKLSPYIPGQVVIATEKGGLYIYDARLAVMVIRDSGTTPQLCLFGPHPRYLLWVERGHLYSADLRTAKLPLHSASQSVPMGKDVQDISCAVNEDCGLYPFRLFVATKQHLMLIDLRQPAEPVLAAMHHLQCPPTSITTSHLTHNKISLVLVSSSESNVVFCYASLSCVSVVLLVSPHIVCVPSDVLKCIRKSDLYALACQVEYRFTQPMLGAALHCWSQNTYGAVMLTQQGDIFYQFWQYHTSLVQETPYLLTQHQYGSLKLWMKEAYAQKKEILLKSSTPSPPGIRRDMDYIANYLLSGQSEHYLLTLCTKKSTSNTDASELETPRNTDASEVETSRNTDASEVGILKRLYQQLVPSSELDVTMVTEWTKVDMKEAIEEIN